MVFISLIPKVIQSWVFARHRAIGARQKVAPGQKSAGGGGA